MDQSYFDRWIQRVVDAVEILATAAERTAIAAEHASGSLANIDERLGDIDDKLNAISSSMPDIDSNDAPIVQGLKDVCGGLDRIEMTVRGAANLRR